MRLMAEVSAHFKKLARKNYAKFAATRVLRLAAEFFGRIDPTFDSRIDLRTVQQRRAEGICATAGDRTHLVRFPKAASNQR
jgi:hypothetical protein